MTTPALQEHKPRELTDVLIADRERLRKWIEHIQKITVPGTRIGNACALALQGADPP